MKYFTFVVLYLITNPFTPRKLELFFIFFTSLPRCELLPARVIGPLLCFSPLENSEQVTGRMILAAQNRPEGVLLTFNPAEVLSVSFEYDRYDSWSAVDKEQGHMLVLSPTSPTVKLQAGQTIKMDYSLKILADANSMIK